MFSNRLAFVVVGLACVTAAAGGGYLATRQLNPPTAAESASATGSGPGPGLLPPAAPGTQAVNETEGVINDTPAPAVSSSPAKSSAAVLTTKAGAPSRPSSGKAAPAPAQPSAPARPSAPAQPSTPEPVSSAASAVETAQPTARDEEPRAPEVARAPEPPARTFEELVVTADSVLGLQIETTVSSERARVEDRVDARVVRDVRVGGAVAIPAGSRAIGSVMTVERGGKVKDRARLGIRFHTLVLADGTHLPIATETMYRNGDAPGNASAAKIGGGAAAGAILGAIIGGAKGAAIGGSVGAGAGTAAVMSGDRSAATFPAGADVTARFVSPITVTVEK